MKTLFEVHVILRDEVNKSASLLMKRLTNMIELHNSLAKFHQSLSEILGLGGDAIFRSEIKSCGLSYGFTDICCTFHAIPLQKRRTYWVSQ